MENQKPSNQFTAANFATTPELCKAVVRVMLAVRGIEKGATVGSGRNSYKGVKDIDVKRIYKQAMAANGLCILPIGVDTKVHIESWRESGQYGEKQKYSVFTEAWTNYLLMHESGESQVIQGYGHGQDSLDKSAGKATTYAMKYALLYLFMAEVGDIDDTDATHNDDAQTTRQAAQQQPTTTKATNQKKVVYTKALAVQHAKTLNNYIANGDDYQAIEKKILVKFLSIDDAAKTHIEGLINVAKSTDK